MAGGRTEAAWTGGCGRRNAADEGEVAIGGPKVTREAAGGERSRAAGAGGVGGGGRRSKAVAQLEAECRGRGGGWGGRRRRQDPILTTLWLNHLLAPVFLLILQHARAGRILVSKERKWPLI